MSAKITTRWRSRRARPLRMLRKIGRIVFSNHIADHDRQNRAPLRQRRHLGSATRYSHFLTAKLTHPAVAMPAWKSDTSNLRAEQFHYNTWISFRIGQLTP